MTHPMTVIAKELQAGDSIVLSEGVLMVEDNAEESSSIPGLVRVEVEVGVMYFDPIQEIDIVR